MAHHPSLATPHAALGTCHGLFVTGTDTGVGKTLMTCALLHAFARRGWRALGMKPIAAGAQYRGAELVNEDIEALAAASNVAAARALTNPYCFELPVAPHIAAERAGVRIELAPIKRAFDELARQAGLVMVEGVGGFCVPLNEREDSADLATLLALPVVLVVGLRLGCLNHALLTAAAIRTRGLELAGWIANGIDPEMACVEENVATLARRLDAPCIANIAFQGAPAAERIAALLDIDALVRTR